MGKVLILGAHGMIGRALAKICCEKGLTIDATIRDDGNAPFSVPAACRTLFRNIDIARDEALQRLEKIIHEGEYSSVVNCIGVVKQKIVSEMATITSNKNFPAFLSSICHRACCRLIHISSDCVFSGKAGAYYANDIPDAEDLYGKSKIDGENATKTHLVIRTSFIGWELREPRVGLLEWFYRQKKDVVGYTNSLWSGMTACCLSENIVSIMHNAPRLSGIHHLAADPISKYHLLELLKDHFQKKITIIPAENPRIDRRLIMNDEIGRFVSIPSHQEMIAALGKNRN